MQCLIYLVKWIKFFSFLIATVFLLILVNNVMANFWNLRYINAVSTDACLWWICIGKHDGRHNSHRGIWSSYDCHSLSDCSNHLSSIWDIAKPCPVRRTPTFWLLGAIHCVPSQPDDNNSGLEVVQQPFSRCHDRVFRHQQSKFDLARIHACTLPGMLQFLGICVLIVV